MTIAHRYRALRANLRMQEIEKSSVRSARAEFAVLMIVDLLFLLFLQEFDSWQ
jgi:hypothetical protein